MNDLVSGREDCDPRSPHNRQFSASDGRQHAGFPGGELRAAEDDGFPPADVRSRKRHRGTGNALVPGDDRVSLNVGEFDGQHGIRSAGQHPARRDRRRRSRQHFLVRRNTRGDRFGVESKQNGLDLGSSVGVLGANRKAVHVGSVETGHVDFGPNVLGQHPAQSVLERDRFRGQRGDVEGCAPAALGFVTLDHFEKLLLFHGATSSGISSS